MGLKKTLLGVLVAVIAITLATEDAQAFWGSRGSWGSYGGSWGGGGSLDSGGSAGSHGSYGSHGGGFLRRIFRGSHGSHGSYGSAGSHGSHGGHAHGSYGSHGGGYAASEGVYSGYAVNSSAAAERMVSAPATKTKLTLHVPADAKVTLAGVETKQTGEVREFTTRKLASGQAWGNYAVQVEVTRDGKTLSEVREITLTGGSSQELSIEFDEALQLATL